MATGDPMPVAQLGAPAQDVEFEFKSNHLLDGFHNANLADLEQPRRRYQEMINNAVDYVNSARKRTADEILESAAQSASVYNAQHNQGIFGSSTGSAGDVVSGTTTSPLDTLTTPYDGLPITQPSPFSQPINWPVYTPPAVQPDLSIFQNQINQLQNEVLRLNALVLKLETENEELKKRIPFKEPGRALDV